MPRELIEIQIMEKYKWDYDQLLNCPKIHYDWIIEMMNANGEKSRHDNNQRSVRNTRTPNRRR